MDASLALQYAIIAVAVVVSAWVVLKKQFPGPVRKARIALALLLCVGAARADVILHAFNWRYDTVEARAAADRHLFVPAHHVHVEHCHRAREV